MASTREETQIQWSASSEITISNTDTWNLSDAVTFNAEDWDAELMLWADNQGSPASGDIVTVGIAYTGGEVDGSAGNDYTNPENIEPLRVLDTYNNDDGNGVVLRSVPIRTAALGFKLAVKAATGATRNVKFRARLVTRRNAVA